MDWPRHCCRRSSSRAGKTSKAPHGINAYAFKANVWVAIFGFIGNYWYTHYFYNVLEASYTMPSWDINGVPIPMFFATHFYFCFYHVLSNMAIRKAWSSLAPGAMRSLLWRSLVLVMSYVTAFMGVADDIWISMLRLPGQGHRVHAWVCFLWNLFHRFISNVFAARRQDAPVHSSHRITATGMAVLCLLDFVRVGLGKT